MLRVERDWRLQHEDDQEQQPEPQEQGNSNPQEQDGGGNDSGSEDGGSPSDGANADGDGDDFEKVFDETIEKALKPKNAGNPEEGSKPKPRRRRRGNPELRTPKISKPPKPQKNNPVSFNAGSGGAEIALEVGDKDKIKKSVSEQVSEAYANDKPLSGLAQKMVQEAVLGTKGSHIKEGQAGRRQINLSSDLGLLRRSSVEVLQQLVEAVYEKNAHATVPAFDPLNTKQSDVPRDLANDFSTLLSRLSEEMSGKDIRGSEFWDIDRLLYRSISKVPLESCKKARSKERIMLIVDTSPSCTAMAEFYSALARIAITQGDVDVVLAPNFRVETLINNNGIYPLSDDGGSGFHSILPVLDNSRIAPMFTNRNIIMLGDTDGDKVPELLATGNNVLWLYYSDKLHSLAKRYKASVRHKNEKNLFTIGLQTLQSSNYKKRNSPTDLAEYIHRGAPSNRPELSLDRVTQAVEACHALSREHCKRGYVGEDIPVSEYLNFQLVSIALVSQGVIPKFTLPLGTAPMFEKVLELIRKYPVYNQLLGIKKIANYANGNPEQVEETLRSICALPALYSGNDDEPMDSDQVPFAWLSVHDNQNRTYEIFAKMFAPKHTSHPEFALPHYLDYRVAKIKNLRHSYFKKRRNIAQYKGDGNSWEEAKRLTTPVAEPYTSGKLKVVPCMGKGDLKRILNNKAITF